MSRSLAGVCSPAAVTPSMSGSWPAATWMPTPVRNPTSTVRERKFARNPSLANRASSSIAPANRAASPASSDVAWRPGHRQTGKRGGKYDGGSRIRGHHEVARRTEDRVHGHRQQHRVQAGHHRHPGDLRVPEDLGDAQGGQRQAGEHIRGYLGPVDGQQPPHRGQRPQPSSLATPRRIRQRLTTPVSCGSGFVHHPAASRVVRSQQTPDSARAAASTPARSVARPRGVIATHLGRPPTTTCATAPPPCAPPWRWPPAK